MYIRQTSGSPVTCFKPVANLHHLFILNTDPAWKETLGTLRTAYLYFFFLPSVFKSMLVRYKIWTVCFLMEGSRQSHYVACA